MSRKFQGCTACVEMDILVINVFSLIVLCTESRRFLKQYLASCALYFTVCTNPKVFLISHRTVCCQADCSRQIKAKGIRGHKI